MRLSAYLIAATAFLTLAIPASVSPAVADDAATCTGGSGDERIGACTRAIKSGRWRGAGLAWAYVNRGVAYYDRGNYDRAVADYGEAISIDPKYADAYFTRGRFYFYSGPVAKAQADFKQMSELDPKDAYAALFLDLAERRNDIPSHLAEAAKQLDMTAWPAPVVRLFLGQITPAAVLDSAQDSDARKQKGQVCEANFYGGELALLQGTKVEATRLLQLAASDCPDNFIRADAKAELKRLDSSP